MPGGDVTTLAEWFPFIDQMSPSMKGLCSIVFATLVALTVVVSVVFHGRKGASTGQDSK
jgi:hypothetical protein